MNGSGASSQVGSEVTEHVAFIVNNYPPHRGGVERHVHSLAGALTRQGTTCTVITLSDDVGETIEDGVTVIRMPHRLRVGSVLSFPRLGAGRRIRTILRQRAVTVVSTHTRFFPLSWIGTRAARSQGIPALHTEHGSGFVRGVSPVIAIASRMVDLTVGRATLRSATRVLAVSDSVATFVKRLAGVEAQVFYNAINLEEWQRSAETAPPTRFVFLGRLVPGKGWDALLAAFATLDQQCPGLYSVDIVGDGPDRQKAIDDVRRRGLEGRVVVHGHVEGEKLRDLLATGVLVNPTTLSEGFQTSLIEALACGANVVTYDVPGAALLRADGAPVAIVEPTPVALAAGMREAVENPKPVYDSTRLARWGWAARSSDYLDTIRSLRVES